jgi:hypothetical protein
MSRMLHGVLTQSDCASCCTCRYGNLVLAVEVISSTATFGYAILLIKQSRPRPSLGLPLADSDEVLHPDDVMFNLRVLVPCYKEKVGLVRACHVSNCKCCYPALCVEAASGAWHPAWHLASPCVTHPLIRTALQFGRPPAAVHCR